jgi:hypothetical protein
VEDRKLSVMFVVCVYRLVAWSRALLMQGDSTRDTHEGVGRWATDL